MIEISHARANNLKNISLKIPRDKLIVIAGVSGSGKSSLAFDTLYAEGQRRYVESLSSYARQFLGRMSKPECDYIKGLPPAIAIEQKVISRNPRSTVGTTTEIYEYLRMLYARIGRTFSPISGQEVRKHTVEDVIACTSEYPKGTKFIVTAPLHVAESRTIGRQLEMSVLAGYSRIYYKGEIMRIEDSGFLDSKETSTDAPLSLLIDRMSVDDSKDAVSRLTDSLETAFYEGQGACSVIFMPAMIEHQFSNRFEADGIVFEEPSDNMFSFNSPAGACPKCEGYGKIIGIDEALVITNPSLSVYEGCVQCWHGEKMKVWKEEFCRRAVADNFPIFEPYYNLSDEHKGWLWHGLPSERDTSPHERVSIDEFFRMLTENQYKIQYRVMLSRYRGKTKCPECHGTRLKKEANYVRIGADANGNGGKTITQLVNMSIEELHEWFSHIRLTEHEQKIAKRLLTEITSRIEFMLNIGLGYLTLNRPSNTLSGGESQRINLCTSLGSSLIGSLYILDEPSIGLHPRDTSKLISVVRQLQELGNTVIIVEHDEEIMRSADYLIDIGPDAGRHGGEVVYEGPVSDITADTLQKYPLSHTIAYLSHAEEIELPVSRRPWNQRITIRSPRLNNLKGTNVDIPLNVMTVVTGVSGSGKSSLIKGILYPALRRALGDACDAPGLYGGLDGDVSSVKHVEFVDQNPIGKSARSNPATYVKAFDAIRQLIAEQPLAKQMGYTPQYFSFNATGGRCEECKGAGYITVEMQFMADLELVCDACHGKRFKREVLDVKYRGKNIYDILEMTINQAIEFFSADVPASCRRITETIISRLKPLQDVGLGYIKLGQSSSTLSGGENQRVKLGYYIGQEKQEPTLFIFDEPTTGLHFHDIKRLLSAFDALIKRGHTVLIIEHNLDVIKCADHIIDIGPEGGHKGGDIVATGTPEDIVRCDRSITGRYLKHVIGAL
ncbi:MAG: excinuclease ABC subunit UvrA [Prevotella sp.]